MTESKATRDYIKNWGRTAAHEHTTQTFDCYNTGLHIGKVTVEWSDVCNDFIWDANCSFDTRHYPITCTRPAYSEIDAKNYIHNTYYILMESMTFGKWLQIMMKRHEMTQAGLGERLDVSRVSVNHWVTGKRECTGQHWHDLAFLFAHLEQITDAQMLGHMSLLFKRKN